MMMVVVVLEIMITTFPSEALPGSLVSSSSFQLVIVTTTWLPGRSVALSYLGNEAELVKLSEIREVEPPLSGSRRRL